MTHESKPSNFPREKFRDRTILGLDLVDTCTSHPEQYDVFDGQNLVAYFRQRECIFIARVPDAGGREVFVFTSESHGLLNETERDAVLLMAVKSVKAALEPHCQSFDDLYEEFEEDDEEESWEPVGSCEDCGVNLYSDDDPEYCDQCIWARRAG